MSGPKLKSAVRLLALPLTRAGPGREALVYYIADFPPKAPVNEQDESLVQKYTRQGTNKLLGTWNEWGQKSPTSWQKRLHNFGERAQAKLQFEEIALRSIDPALGPKMMSEGRGAELEAEMTKGKSVSVPLIYPASFLSLVGQDPLRHLEAHVSYRLPKHRKRFWTYTILAPLTAPFALVPIVPNIPFFFCVWRAWSNYKAMSAAGYLQSLIRSNAITSNPDKSLDSLFTSEKAMQGTNGKASKAAKSPSKPPESEDVASATSTRESSKDVFTLSEASLGELFRLTRIPEDRRHALVNAIDQSRTRLQAEK